MAFCDDILAVKWIRSFAFQPNCIFGYATNIPDMTQAHPFHGYRFIRMKIEWKSQRCKLSNLTLLCRMAYVHIHCEKISPRECDKNGKSNGREWERRARRSWRSVVYAHSGHHNVQLAHISFWSWILFASFRDILLHARAINVKIYFKRNSVDIRFDGRNSIEDIYIISYSCEFV